MDQLGTGLHGSEQGEGGLGCSLAIDSLGTAHAAVAECRQPVVVQQFLVETANLQSGCPLRESQISF